MSPDNNLIGHLILIENTPRASLSDDDFMKMKQVAEATLQGLKSHKVTFMDSLMEASESDEEYKQRLMVFDKGG
jgi:hypothetical protein